MDTAGRHLIGILEKVIILEQAVIFFTTITTSTTTTSKWRTISSGAIAGFGWSNVSFVPQISSSDQESLVNGTKLSWTNAQKESQ
jgi:hypothetical protein